VREAGDTVNPQINVACMASIIGRHTAAAAAAAAKLQLTGQMNDE